MRDFVRRAAVILAFVVVTPVAAGAQTAPTVTAGAQTPSPVMVSEFFVIPWNDASSLACMTFSNATERAIQAVRFDLTSAQPQNPLDPDIHSQGHIDRVGSFAPGVAIRAPARFMGTVNRNSSALINCWSTDLPSNIKTQLGISIEKVVYADGTVWVNPSPQPLATVSY